MILHVDMDAFYASIEQRDRPELRGRPVVVGGDPSSRSVVSAASYEARRFGIHSAMPCSQARRLCPHAVFVPVRMRHYVEVSSQIRAIFEQFTPLVEPLSLDEAFLDVSGSVHLFGPPESIARQIKNRIRDELHLTASAGVAPSKFLAKIASDLEKPDGLVVVEPGHVQEFLDPLPVERLWGAGRVTSRRFHELGIRTIGQLRHVSLETLCHCFGQASGQHFHQLAHGIDPRKVVPDHEAKSLSHETTFEKDIEDPEVLRVVLLDLTDQVARRLRRHRLRARGVHIKVRFADFTTLTRSATLREATHLTASLWEAVEDLFAKWLARRSEHRPIRLLGVGVSRIEHSTWTQPTLFDAEQRKKQRDLDQLVDQLKETFGNAAIRRAVHLGEAEPREEERRRP